MLFCALTALVLALLAITLFGLSKLIVLEFGFGIVVALLPAASSIFPMMPGSS
jgi:hypothetical protein